jgi:hypothetical protein
MTERPRFTVAVDFDGVLFKKVAWREAEEDDEFNFGGFAVGDI